MAGMCNGDPSSSEEEESSALDKKEYDVTFCCEALCCTSNTLTLEPEEVDHHVVGLCSEQRKRLPYGELGDVTHVNSCGCGHSITAGESLALCPGCGCSGELVDEIVQELKTRMKRRGDTGNILRAEQGLKIMAHLSAKTDALLRHWVLPAPQQRPSEPQPLAFATMQYDVTDICHMICCCGSKTLSLDPEEAVLDMTTLCSTSKSRRPYGQLIQVEAAANCGCCAAVSSSMGPMSPGCGCEKEKVAEIVEQLKVRMKARGDTGNILRQEELNRLILEQEARLSEVCKKMGVQVPLAQPPLAQRMV